MKNLFFLLSISILSSCIKPVCCINISSNFDFYVVDNQGIDLLNPDGTTALDLNTIRVYYLLDGIKTEIKRGNLDAPQMYFLSPPEGERTKFSIRLFLNTEDSESITTTYFEWNKDSTDVFTAEVSREKNNTYVKKVWLNDSLVWDISTANGKRLYELVK